MPVVSPNAISSQPASRRRSAMPNTRSGGTSPSYGQPNDHGDHALAAQALLARAGDHPLQPAQRLLDRAVHVLLVVGLARGEEQVHLGEAVAQLERVVEPALVGDQHRHRHVVGDVRSAQHLGAVGELGDHVGAHEARDLEAPQARARERLDQLDLGRGRDHLGLVLEAVARADLADADAVHSDLHHAEAAAHADRLAGHERRVVAGQVGDRGGHLVRLAPAGAWRWT